MPVKQLIKLAQRPIAAIMVAWLSGFLLLFCCDTPSAKAADEHCPLSQKSEHCDKGAKTNEDSFSIHGQTKHTDTDCCAYLPIIFDKARKVERTEKTALAPDLVRAHVPKFRPVVISFLAEYAYSPPVLYRDKIFITNCVFRI